MPYDPDFIPMNTIPLPLLSAQTLASALNDGAPIEHEKFSIVFNADRGFAIVGASNVDGASMIEAGVIKRKGFRLDPSADRTIQVDNDRGYVNNRWDRGHLVRRRSLQWGDLDEATGADRQSSFWTNIAPQHETLHDTAWGDIEDFVLELTDAADRRASIFTGPVLTPDDPLHTNKPGELPIQIPAGYWKVMAIRPGGALRAAGFLVWQRDFDKPEPVVFAPFLEQVRLTTIEYLTGLSFPDILHTADPLQFGTQTNDLVAALGTGAPAGPQFNRSSVITAAADILLG